MATTMLGSLLVSLGLDSGEFKSGLTDAEKRLKATERQFKKLGKQISGIGKALTVGLTGPIAAVGTAFGMAANKMASESREIAKSAQVAGESFEAFQRQAHAASSVGIEFDKLGDIFKDVRDRVGDFAATGGGPMADFFENIAPKVGVTAKAFEGLSGKQALQLYFDSLKKANVSQEEMVFYLEAMASDATNLIPLLEKGGKAFDELGAKASIVSDEDRANLEKYNIAQEQMGQATKKLTIALVNSGVLEAITSLVEGFAKFTSQLAETNPGVLKAAVVIGGIAAAVGPVLVALGGLVSIAPALAAAFGAIKVAALGLMANPVILGFAAVVGGIYLAWKNWDKISAIVRNVYNGVKTWIVDKLGAIFGWVKGKIEGVKNAFRDMYIAVVGNSYVPDMVDEIGQHMRRLDNLMVAQAVSATKKTKDAFKQLRDDLRPLLAELFPQEALEAEYRAKQDVLEQGLRDGEISPQRFQEAMERAQAAYWGERAPGSKPEFNAEPLDKNLADGIAKAGAAIDVNLPKINTFARDLREGLGAAFDELGYQLQGVLVGAQSVMDGLRNLVSRMLSMSFEKLWGSLGASLKIPGFAEGTKFAPGGLALVGEKGPELVNLKRGSQVINNRDLTGLMAQRSAAPSQPVYMTVNTPNADSFRRSSSQITRELRRKLNG
ncbi:phage tail tape measure protein [Qipengyuania seohaensis]|uniref:hypothetical protein n=1 Tax=Qipengyuania seohaensis TaxID=266951 RepID=UPI000C222137|nr:hypothetical protein [Qipengyuania seohaensis]